MQGTTRGSVLDNSICVAQGSQNFGRTKQSTVITQKKIMYLVIINLNGKQYVARILAVENMEQLDFQLDRNSRKDTALHERGDCAPEVTPPPSKGSQRSDGPKASLHAPDSSSHLSTYTAVLLTSPPQWSAGVTEPTSPNPSFQRALSPHSSPRLLCTSN
jgi:hypothetical protein